MQFIKWTKPAAKRKANILKYWTKRNGSPTYSAKIENESNKAETLISANPFIGTEVEDLKDVRRLFIMKYYSLFYRVKENHVEILSFWDNRQDPEKIEL